MGGVEFEFVEYFIEGAKFRFNALKAKMHTQIAGAAFYQIGAACGNQRNFDSGIAQHLDALAVCRMKCFDFGAAVGVIQAAIGEHTVNVERHQLQSC